MRVASLFWLLLVSACGAVRVDGGASSDAAPSTEVDAGPGAQADSAPAADASAGCSWSPLSTGLFEMVNTGAGEISPVITSNGLVVHFIRGTKNYSVGNIFRALRATPDGAFSAAEPIEELDSGEGDYGLEISPDGREVFFSRVGGGSLVTSQLTGDTWGPVSAAGLIGYSPAMAAGGLDLYFVSTEVAGEIHRATRAAVGAAWDPPQPVGSVGTHHWIDVSDDGRKLLLSGGGSGSSEQPVAIAARESLEEPFGEAVAFDPVLGGGTGILQGKASWVPGADDVVVIDVEMGNPPNLYYTRCE